MDKLSQEIKEAVEGIDERKTCEEMFELVEPHRHIAGDDKKYEDIRADYNACVKLHEDVDNRIASLKSEMEVVEHEMNASVGGISQELFTKHYEACRDLSAAMGMEANIILRRASSAVVFYDVLTTVKGSLN